MRTTELNIKQKFDRVENNLIKLKGLHNYQGSSDHSPPLWC